MKWRRVVCLAGAAAVSLCAENARAQFEVTREHGREVRPDAAYDPERDQYLVVWEHQGTILGKIISGWGDTVREPFIVSALAPTGGVTYSFPAVTFKSPEDVYFVVALVLDPRGPLPWNSVDLFRLAPDGTRLSVRGLATGPAGTLASPDVEADTFGTDCCVLAVWETGGGSLVGQRLTGAGALHGPALHVFDRGARFPNAFHPRLVYQRPADAFVVAFDRHDTAISSSIAVRSVGAFSGLPSAEVSVARLTIRPPRPGVPAGFPDLAYNDHGRAAGQDRFLVVWRDGDEVHQRRLNGSRAPLGAAGRLCLGAPCATTREVDQPAVGAETGTPYFVATYTREDAGGVSTLRGAAVNGSTGAFTEVFAITDPTVRPAGNAALVWDAGRSNFLAVWEEDAGFPFDEDLWAGFLSRP